MKVVSIAESKKSKFEYMIIENGIDYSLARWNPYSNHMYEVIERFKSLDYLEPSLAKTLIRNGERIVPKSEALDKYIKNIEKRK